MARFSQINYSHSLNQAAYDFFLQHPLPQVTVHPYINYSRYLFDPLQRRPVWARNQPHPTEVQSIYSSLHPLLQTHVMKQMKLHKNNPKTYTLTCMPDVATFQTASQLSMHFFLLFFLFFFFFFIRPIVRSVLSPPQWPSNTHSYSQIFPSKP